MRKYEEDLTVEFGHEYHKILSDAYRNGTTVDVNTDDYSGSVKVVNLRNEDIGGKVHTVFTIWSV